MATKASRAAARMTGAEAESRGATTMGIRPEHITVWPTEGAWQGTVGVSEHLGSDTFFYVHLDGRDELVTVRAGGDLVLQHGDTIYLTPEESRIHRFDAQGLRIA